MLNVLAIALGSAIGGVSRYGLSALVHRFAGQSFPYGTLVVNVFGCFGIGCLLYLVEDMAAVGPMGRLFLGAGLLGGFTTFSAFGLETVELVRDGCFGLALVNVSANVIIGLCAVWLGRDGARLLGT